MSRKILTCRKFLTFLTYVDKKMQVCFYVEDNQFFHVFDNFKQKMIDLKRAKTHLTVSYFVDSFSYREVHFSSSFGVMKLKSSNKNLSRNILLHRAYFNLRSIRIYVTTDIFGENCSHDFSDRVQSLDCNRDNKSPQTISEFNEGQFVFISNQFECFVLILFPIFESNFSGKLLCKNLLYRETKNFLIQLYFKNA